VTQTDASGRSKVQSHSPWAIALHTLARLKASLRSRGVVGTARLIGHEVPRQLVRLVDPHFHDRYYSRVYAREFKNRRFTYEPVISLVMPVYNQERQYLQRCIESVRRQKYPKWEFCIADDASTLPYLKPYLAQMQAQDPRIKITTVEKNLHISRATNAALKTATGDYILLIDSDDILFTPWALTAFVDGLQEHREDILYADNVMIDERDGVCSYARKPQWEEDFLFSTFFVTHPSLIARELVEKLGGFRYECTYALDVDFFNRVSVLSPRIGHVRKYLYGWRMLPGSVTTSTDAKPAVITNSLTAHNDLLGDRKAFARSVWPEFFEQRRTGAFKLEFSNLAPQVGSPSLVLVCRDDAAQPVDAAAISQAVPYGLERVMLCMGGSRPPQSPASPSGSVQAVDWQSLRDVCGGLSSQYLLFLDASLRLESPSAVDELLGYLALNPRIGVVSGKVLTPEGRIASSSYVFLKQLLVFGEGQDDESYHGYWYKNRLAHNALAVPGGFFAARRDVVVKYGLDHARYGGLAVADLCLRMRADGMRVVYNPWARAVADKLPLHEFGESHYARFKAEHAQYFGHDPYYIDYP
jgi:glycosyltransferase involved in cell wall biosynthesis